MIWTGILRYVLDSTNVSLVDPLQQIADQLIDFLFLFLSTMSTHTLTWIKSYLNSDIKHSELRFLVSVKCLDAIFLASYFLLILYGAHMYAW